MDTKNKYQALSEGIVCALAILKDYPGIKDIVNLPEAVLFLGEIKHRAGDITSPDPQEMANLLLEGADERIWAWQETLEGIHEIDSNLNVSPIDVHTRVTKSGGKDWDMNNEELIAGYFCVKPSEEYASGYFVFNPQDKACIYIDQNEVHRGTWTSAYRFLRDYMETNHIIPDLPK